MKEENDIIKGKHTIRNQNRRKDSCPHVGLDLRTYGQRNSPRQPCVSCTIAKEMTIRSKTNGKNHPAMERTLWPMMHSLSVADLAYHFSKSLSPHCRERVGAKSRKTVATRPVFAVWSLRPI